MGKRKYPPLKKREVEEILRGLGFKPDRQEASHRQWERDADASHPRALVTVDTYDDFEEKMIKSLISQSTFTREQFYGATKKTAKKIQ